ncbi:MAG: hypothetical protein P1Q69_18555 [Candidatus Thorarchaeota archaeon]|nr:hypothetical protein [Candidatus Thorarchaeota archaeon]
MGRWLAVGTELPCSVIALFLVGQIIGQALGGLQGGTYGALIGAICGFFLGVYGVYMTIQYYDRLEVATKEKTPYMPSKEEIFEDVKFDIPDDER